MTRELVIWLLQQGHQPQHLKPSANGEVEALQQCLQEAIALRELGNPRLSLQLLQRLQAEGLESPWILDNAARALVDLGSWPQAIELWERLTGHDDPAAAQIAQDTLLSVVNPFLEELQTLCRQWHWEPRQLPKGDQPLEGNLLVMVLEEAIGAREAGSTELSLALLEAAERQGWQSPWLHDNRARALVHQGRRDEACAIWEELQEHADATAAAEALNMLGQYQPARIRHPQRDRVLELEREGRRHEAQTALLNAVLEHPNDAALWTLLEDRQQLDEPADGLLQQELRAVDRRLAAEEQLLNHLEQQLQV